MKALIHKLKNNRISYFLYFIKSTNWDKLANDLKYIQDKTKKSKLTIYVDMLWSSLYLGNSFHEYCYYGFYEKDSTARKQYATMAFMYEYQLKQNPPIHREVLEDKLLFFKKYSEYLGRGVLNCATAGSDELYSFFRNKSKVVLKKSTGGGGKNVEIIKVDDFSPDQLRSYIVENGYDIAEEFVIQHRNLMDLSPHSLNTVRCITQFNTAGEVIIIGTSLRMGIYNNTDNLSSGGIACPVDINTGKICGNGVSFDITTEDFSVHPVSKLPLVGFKIPYWNEVKAICIAAAKVNTSNKSIGWDVAISDNGPMLIEGNHDWGARVWQMPVKKGLKYKLV